MSNWEPVELTRALIAAESVTPDPGPALQLLESWLSELGFETHLLTFSEDGWPDVKNLYARWGKRGFNFCFAGHSDVVPVGDTADWNHPPFSPVEKNGELFGRGAADMKGALGAMVAAVARFVEHKKGDTGSSISFLITGDEEGPAINGTRKVLQWLKDQGEVLDYCLVGEPTNPLALGDMIKIGRRGSLHGVIRIQGNQGHVAYPHLANNPIPGLLKILTALTESPFDQGNEHFQPSNLEVLDLHVGNDADNVIPPEARARFNIRFNTEWTPDELMAEIIRRCESVGVAHSLEFRLSGDAFLTRPGPLTETVVDAVATRLGQKPELSTTGGTSDARFIKDMCPVVEMGLVGATMHKVNERARVEDIRALADIYHQILVSLLDPESKKTA
jgi:succinyl-diaminopimelate desuccinylase